MIDTNAGGIDELVRAAESRWHGEVSGEFDKSGRMAQLTVCAERLRDVSRWLFADCGYRLLTLVVMEDAEQWTLRYIFLSATEAGQMHVVLRQPLSETVLPSISAEVHAADWHERETEDLFGLQFEGHPRLGDFVLHEEWPEGVNPMRRDFDAWRPYPHREVNPQWRPVSVVQAPGSFLMPIGPVYSDYAESAQFFLETVGEDVIRTIPRLFFKYRGVEKIAEGRSLGDVLLLAERFSGTSAFAHSLAFCLAVERIAGVEPPPRARALRVLLAEFERFRHHTAAIGGVCASTGLAVAASQAAILEEELLRLSCRYTGHRYLFGLNRPGGVTDDITDSDCRALAGALDNLNMELRELSGMLRFSSSFLDRLEEVGIVTREKAVTYGLVGPVARASGVTQDLRKTHPYSGYDQESAFEVPVETEGDGYARLRVLFDEAEQSAGIVQQLAEGLPVGPVYSSLHTVPPGETLGWVEAPRGAAFHWIAVGDDGRVARYRITPPSFTNWHGFHLAAEDFAFQDFPIIMATFGLSNAECDR